MFVSYTLETTCRTIDIIHVLFDPFPHQVSQSFHVSRYLWFGKTNQSLGYYLCRCLIGPGDLGASWNTQGVAMDSFDVVVIFRGVRS
jgi:hypothetical protein